MMAVTLIPIFALFGGWTNYVLRAAEQPFVFGIYITLYSFVMYLLINGYFLAKDGQSIGKKVAGTRIVRSDGSKADFKRIIGLRLLPLYALSLIPFAGRLVGLVDSLLIFRQTRKCLHDNIADTIVVNT